MRKSKKKLFRRGSAQKYHKYAVSTSNSTIHSSSLLNVPVIFMSFIIMIGVSLTILSSQSLTQYLNTRDLARMVPQVNIPSILKIPDVDITFSLPEMSKIALPNYKMPTVKTPKLSLLSIPFQKYLSDITSVTTNVFGYLAKILNPMPHVMFIFHLGQQTLHVISTISGNIISSVFNILRRIDLKPIIAFIRTYAGIVMRAAYSFSLAALRFMNPLPVLEKIFLFQSVLLKYVFQTIMVGLRMVYEGAYITGKILVMMVNKILHFVIFIARVLLNTIVAIYNGFVSIIQRIYQAIKSVFITINRQIQGIQRFLNPYVAFAVTVFQDTVTNLQTSWNDLRSMSQDVMKTYNQNRQKLSEAEAAK